jgi:hypothetical protein
MMGSEGSELAEPATKNFATPPARGNSASAFEPCSLEIPCKARLDQRIADRSTPSPPQAKHVKVHAAVIGSEAPGCSELTNRKAPPIRLGMLVRISSVWSRVSRFCQEVKFPCPDRRPAASSNANTLPIAGLMPGRGKTARAVCGQELGPFLPGKPRASPVFVSIQVLFAHPKPEIFR